MVQGVDRSPLIPYTTKVINGTAMQLSHPANTITVDFYPEAYIADEGVKRFIKCVTHSTGQKSYSVITKLTFKHEVDSRLALGYDVTDFHTEKFNDYHNYRPLAC